MAKSNTVYQLTITLAEIKPPIWRRVQVKDCSLSKLHEVIQAAMGWTNTHLWAFAIDGVDYGDDPEGDKDLSSDRKAKLRDFVAEGVKKFRYVYDFGDNWEHSVQVEKLLGADATAEYPRCVGGQQGDEPAQVRCPLLRQRQQHGRDGLGPPSSHGECSPGCPPAVPAPPGTGRRPHAAPAGAGRSSWSPPDRWVTERGPREEPPGPRVISSTEPVTPFDLPCVVPSG